MNNDISLPKGTRLGVVSGQSCAFENGNLYVNHSIGRLLEELRRRASGTRFCMPLAPVRTPNLNFPIAMAPGEMSFLPPMSTTISSQRQYLAVRRHLVDFADTVDALFVRLPFQLPNAIQNLGKPMLGHVVSSPLEVVKASFDYTGLVRKLAVTFAAHSEHSMGRLALEPNVRLCTNGQEMWDKLGATHGRVVLSSCLYRHEMVRPRTPAVGSPPRLLFVGYLRPEKGAEDLLDAFDILRAKAPMSLSLVGGSDRETDAGRRMTERIARSPFRKDIHQLGMMDFGDELFDMYRSHDVLIQPSLSEGTPRTLVEARAFGCPVVATRVGGIPTSVTDGIDGVLVPPASPRDLAAGIRRVLEDEEFRKTIVENGLRDRDRYSVEYFANELISEVAMAVQGADGHRPDQVLGEPVEMRPPDVSAVADVHEVAFAKSMGVGLGRAYIESFLRWFIERHGAISLVESDERGPLGYVFGAFLTTLSDMNVDVGPVAAKQIAKNPTLLMQAPFRRELVRRMKLLLGAQERTDTPSLPEPVMSLVGIGTAPSARGRGVGSRLVASFVERARTSGAASVRLSVYRKNTAAIALYKKFGFVPMEHPTNPDVIYCALVLGATNTTSKAELQP